MKNFYFSLCFVCCAFSTHAQIEMAAGRFQIDESIKLIVCNKLPVSSELSGNYVRMDGRNFTFSTTPGTPSFGTKYTVTNSGNNYSLYFTELALLDISLNDGKNIDNIILDSDINGVIRVTDKTGTYSHLSNIAIRVRGASSAGFPKKSYRVTLRNTDYSANKDDAFLGLRSDKRWLMLAMWNEELKFNNVVSHQLWRDIHTLYYLNSEPQAIASIRTKYAEAFINKRYRGVYAFAEDMDRKQLKLKAQANGGELYKGENWDGAVTFDKVPPLPGPSEFWGGWEMKYPDWEVGNWTNFYQFNDFVKNSSNADFSSQINSKINLDSFIDYYLYLNLIFATDNYGKNTFVAKYKTGDPYFIVPWDLDGVFGYVWTGELHNRTGEILSNNLYDRLFELNPNDFKNKIATRWNNLRADQFSLNYLNNLFDTNKNFLESNAVYEREYIVYQSLYNSNYLNYQYANRNNALTKVKNWVKDRVNMLDYYFSPMLTNTAGCDFNVSANASQSKVLPGASLSVNAVCAGANCSGVSYQWKFNENVLGNTQNLSITAPADYGMKTYYLQASKSGCTPKLRTTSYIVNNGDPKVSLSFSMWSTGPVGTRYKIKDIEEGQQIYIGELPSQVNWFVTMNNAQVSNPSGSNYVNFVELKLSRPEYLNFGFGPENIAGGDGGPYGVFGREYGEKPSTGKHQIRAKAINASSEIVSRVVNFTITSNPLPVKLSVFKVVAEGTTALLSWQTTEEVNSDRFEIQHSLNGTKWEVIGEVKAQVESNSITDYTFVHQQPATGINYYRLHMIDADDSDGYSGIRSMKLDSNSSYIYPNPVADVLILEGFHDLIKVEIISANGISVMTIDHDLDEEISLKKLPPGAYLILLSGKTGNVVTKRVVIE